MAAHPHITSRTASLKARAADLHDRLDRLAAPSQARADLLAAYADFAAVRPLFDPMTDLDTPGYRAAGRVEKRLNALIAAAMEGQTPGDAEGLKVLALALTIRAEGLARSHWDNGNELACAARALLAATGMSPPAGFIGFGDEADYEIRDAAAWSVPVRMPAWAYAEVARAA